jgi:hypothetical protein
MLFILEKKIKNSETFVNATLSDFAGQEIKTASEQSGKNFPQELKMALRVFDSDPRWVQAARHSTLPWQRFFAYSVSQPTNRFFNRTTKLPIGCGANRQTVFPQSSILRRAGASKP